MFVYTDSTAVLSVKIFYSKLQHVDFLEVALIQSNSICFHLCENLTIPVKTALLLDVLCFVGILIINNTLKIYKNHALKAILKKKNAF